MNLPPAEQRAWQGHFEKYPYGDFYTQMLLAHIWTSVQQFGGNKNAHPRMIAPWLYVGEKKKEITEPTPEEDIKVKSLQAILDKKNG